MWLIVFTSIDFFAGNLNRIPFPLPVWWVIGRLSLARSRSALREPFVAWLRRRWIDFRGQFLLSDWLCSLDNWWSRGNLLECRCATLSYVSWILLVRLSYWTFAASWLCRNEWYYVFPIFLSPFNLPLRSEACFCTFNFYHPACWRFGRRRLSELQMSVLFALVPNFAMSNFFTLNFLPGYLMTKV